MVNSDSEQLPDHSSQIITVRPDRETATLQKLPYFVGISGTTAGAKGISMNLVIIPAGGAAEPHFHRDYETANNLSDTEPAHAIVSRNDPNEQENVVLYNPNIE